MKYKIIIVVLLILLLGFCIQSYNLHEAKEEIIFLKTIFIPNVINNSYELGKLEGCNRPDDRVNCTVYNNDGSSLFIYENQCGDTYKIVNGTYVPCNVECLI